jgi:hypothetical protein
MPDYQFIFLGQPKTSTASPNHARFGAEGYHSGVAINLKIGEIIYWVRFW